MSLKSALHRLNGKYPMLPHILFFSLIIGFQSGFAMDEDQEVEQMEVGQDELDQQLVAAVRGYYNPNQQATVVDRVDDLLNRGANSNILMDQGGRTPLLHLLIMRDEHENGPIKRRLMELLIRAGADPNSRIGEDGFAFARNTTPLSWSCAVEYRAIFDLLVEHGADIRQHLGNNNGTLLHSAAACWNLELCEFLLREGFDVNAVDDNGNTPLHSVCNRHFAIARAPQNNALAVITLLLDWGAQVNLENNMRRSPLHLAITNNTACASVRPVVRALLARGADFNSLKFPLEHADYVHHRISKRYFKERRKLCELILTHQVHANKGTITLLCFLRKMGLEGNDGARALYRYRDQLLTPYLRRLYIPLGELLRELPEGLQMPLQRLLQGPRLDRLGKTYISGFRGFGANFPNNNFNIDFLDPERIPETYQNLNRNIYRGFQQPRVIALAGSSPVLINNNNNEPLKEEPPMGAPALAPNDPDSDDDHSDDDTDDIWPLIRAQNPDEVRYMPTEALHPGETEDDIWPMMSIESYAQWQRERQDADREAERVRQLGTHPTPSAADSTKEQPAPKGPQLNSNNSNIPIVVFAVAIYGAIGYTLYKCYTKWKKRIEKEKREKKEGQSKKYAASVGLDSEALYA